MQHLRWVALFVFLVNIVMIAINGVNLSRIHRLRDQAQTTLDTLHKLDSEKMRPCIAGMMMAPGQTCYIVIYSDPVKGL